jgi:hypothetical protein
VKRSPMQASRGVEQVVRALDDLCGKWVAGSIADRQRPEHPMMAFRGWLMTAPVEKPAHVAYGVLDDAQISSSALDAVLVFDLNLRLIEPAVFGRLPTVFEHGPFRITLAEVAR